jgi:hypothetical protein
MGKFEIRKRAQDGLFGFSAFRLFGFSRTLEIWFYCTISGKYLSTKVKTKCIKSTKLFLQEGELILQLFPVS